MAGLGYKLRCLFGVALPGFAQRAFYLAKLRRWPHFRHPRDINEKIQWLKIHGDNKAIAPLADKFAVRGFVKSRGLEDILVPLLGKFDSVEEFRAGWDGLQTPFIIKANNSSQTLIVVKDKAAADLDGICRTLAGWMKDRIFWGYYMEPHYRYIEPCIIVEKFLEQDGSAAGMSSSLIDYKIWAFDGHAESVWACTNRDSHGLDAYLYDFDWRLHPELQHFDGHFRRGAGELPRPEGLERMRECAEILSKGFPQVRVDLYCVGKKVYFGEMTFTSSGGCMPFYTRDYLLELGELCKL